MQRCEELAELYGAYVYGDTTEDETLRVLEHLRDCKECRNDVKMRELTLTLIPNTAPKLSSEDRQFVALSVKQKLANSASRRSWWQVMMPVARSLSVAATVAIVFAGGAMFGMHMMQRNPEKALPPPGPQNGIHFPAPSSIDQQTEQSAHTDAPLTTFSTPQNNTSQVNRGSNNTSTSRRDDERRIASETNWRSLILEQLVPVPDQSVNDPDAEIKPLLPDALSGFRAVPQVNTDAIPGTLEQRWPVPEEDAATRGNCSDQ